MQILQTLKRKKLKSTKFKIFVDYVTERNLYTSFFRTNKKNPPTLLVNIFVPECLNHKIVYKKIYADFKYDISDHFPIFF